MPRVALRSDTRAAANPYPVEYLRADQFTFVLKAAPYFLEAKNNEQLPVFLDSFFCLWFTMWPDKPGDNADFNTIHSRIQKIRETVLYNLNMASVFHVEVQQSWEEFRAEKLAEYLTRISMPLERSANGRPCPRRFKAPKAKAAPPPPGTKFIVVDDSDVENDKPGAALLNKKTKPIVLVEDSGDEKENNKSAAAPLPAGAKAIVLDKKTKVVVLDKKTKAIVLDKKTKSSALDKNTKPIVLNTINTGN